MANEEHLAAVRRGKEAIDAMGSVILDLIGADLRWAKLRGANLNVADLIEADLREADLSGADLIEANLSEADLSEADLSGADLSGANLLEANLLEANLLEANLSSANLIRACLSGADLSGADMRLADLRNADLSMANLRKADLRSTNLLEAMLPTDGLIGAIVDANTANNIGRSVNQMCEEFGTVSYSIEIETGDAPKSFQKRSLALVIDESIDKKLLVEFLGELSAFYSEISDGDELIIRDGKVPQASEVLV